MDLGVRLDGTQNNGNLFYPEFTHSDRLSTNIERTFVQKKIIWKVLIIYSTLITWLYKFLVDFSQRRRDVFEGALFVNRPF